jgi:futalosine hydrolase
VILVVCALLPELRDLRARAGVEVFACGVGPVEAAAETARKLARGTYDAVVNAGIAGAFRGRARIGDAFTIVEERLADLGLEGGATLTLPGGATLVERASADAALLERIAPSRLPPAKGVTVAQVTTTDSTARRLHDRYDADVESMEGFAILRAAALASVPALEVRGISNFVGDRADAEWNFAAGARAAAAALDAVLERLLTDN